MQILRKAWLWCITAEISLIFQEHGLSLISLTPRKSKKTESLPVTPLAHSNPESKHGSYAVDDHVTSMVSILS